MAYEILGSSARVVVNGYTWDVVEGDCGEDVSTARGDTVSGGQYQQHVPDKRVVNFNFKAIRYSNLNPHAANLYVAPPPTVASNPTISYYPDGSQLGVDATKSWRLTGIWTRYRESFNAKEGLITLEAAGTSTGTYKRPGDA